MNKEESGSRTIAAVGGSACEAWVQERRFLFKYEEKKPKLPQGLSKVSIF